MKYAIRIRDKMGVGMTTFIPNHVATLSEHMGGMNESILKFNSIAEANEYAQSHGIGSYDVEKVS